MGNSQEEKILNNPDNDRVFPVDTVILNSHKNKYDGKLEYATIHTGPFSNELALRMNALAIVFGNDIFFRNGAYKPETEEGRKLLAHELTHVSQYEEKRIIPNADLAGIEREAEIAETQAECDLNPYKPYPVGDKLFYLTERQIEIVTQLTADKVEQWLCEQGYARDEKDYLNLLKTYDEWLDGDHCENCYIPPRISRREDTVVSSSVTVPLKERRDLDGEGIEFEGLKQEWPFGRSNRSFQYSRFPTASNTASDEDEQENSNVNNERQNNNRQQTESNTIILTRTSGNLSAIIHQPLPRARNIIPTPVAPPVPEGRISMQDAFGSDDGPCMFRALLGIAETRAGRPLNQEQLNRARRMYYGRTDNTLWWVNSHRADGGEIANSVLADVINIGLELLIHNERVEFIDRTEPPNIPPGTQATIIGVPATPYHFLEGDAMGNMTYDPLHDLDTYINRRVIRIDAFRFIPIQRQGEP